MQPNGNVFITNIEKATIDNGYYRKVLFTTSKQQLVIQCIKPGEDIPFEIHDDMDQFIRVEKGTGELFVGANKEVKHQLSDGIAVIIPAGTYHQIINTSTKDNLHVYTIYSPPNHSANLVQVDRPMKETGGANINRRYFTHMKYMY